MDGVDGFTVENGTVCLDGECMPSDEFRTFVRHSQYLLDVEPQNIAIVILYIPVFLVAAISNILVIIVIYRFQHLRRSVPLPYIFRRIAHLPTRILTNSEINIWMEELRATSRHFINSV